MADTMLTSKSGILLPPEVSAEIWQDAQDASVVMQKGTKIDLPAAGVDIPLITGDPVASWVGEAERIKVGESTFGSKSIRGRKVALIEVFSNEFKRDLPGLFSALQERLPKTIATAYDLRVLHGAPEANAFDTLRDAQALPLRSASAYDDLVEIDSTVMDADGVTDTYLLAPRSRRVLLGAKDADENPVLLNSIANGQVVPSLLGADVTYAKAAYKAGTPNVLGYAGQFSGNVFYGIVQGIEVALSTEAVIDVSNGVGEPDFRSMFQEDSFALRVIAHLGAAVRDLDKVVKVLDAPAA